MKELAFYAQCSVYVISLFTLFRNKTDLEQVKDVSMIKF